MQELPQEKSKFYSLTIMLFSFINITTRIGFMVFGIYWLVDAKAPITIGTIIVATLILPFIWGIFFSVIAIRVLLNSYAFYNAWKTTLKLIWITVLALLICAHLYLIAHKHQYLRLEGLKIDTDDQITTGILLAGAELIIQTGTVLPTFVLFPAVPPIKRNIQ